MKIYLDLVNIYKICGLALLTVIIVSVLKNQKSPITNYLSEVSAVTILICVLTSISPVISLINTLAGKTENPDVIYILLKACAIAVICQIVSDICKENGENTLSSAVDFAANAEIILLSLPIMTTLINDTLGKISI